MCKELKHYFVSAYGCPVHFAGHPDSERTCSCRTYWATLDRVSDKAWREDHNSRECAEAGGACRQVIKEYKMERKKAAEISRKGGETND